MAAGAVLDCLYPHDYRNTATIRAWIQWFARFALNSGPE